MWHLRNTSTGGTRLALVIPLLLVTVGAAAIGLTRKAPRTAAKATVQMTTDLRYVPARVTISVGDTVSWRNVSAIAHTVTATAGADPFDSGNIAPGENYSRTFTVPGEYRYFCIPHQSQGMVGTVIVKR